MPARTDSARHVARMFRHPQTKRAAIVIASTKAARRGKRS